MVIAFESKTSKVVYYGLNILINCLRKWDSLSWNLTLMLAVLRHDEFEIRCSRNTKHTGLIVCSQELKHHDYSSQVMDEQSH